MDCCEEFTIASAMEMFLTDSSIPNPLECFEDEYSDPATLVEMWHEMRAEMSDECECGECAAEPGVFDDDSMLDVDMDSSDASID